MQHLKFFGARLFCINYKKKKNYIKNGYTKFHWTVTIIITNCKFWFTISKSNNNNKKYIYKFNNEQIKQNEKVHTFIVNFTSVFFCLFNVGLNHSMCIASLSFKTNFVDAESSFEKQVSLHMPLHVVF